jgi:histidine ammonia-lyase
MNTQNTFSELTNSLINEQFNKAVNLIEQGYKHIQYKHGCIKKIKKEDTFFYGVKTGNGTGKYMRIKTELLDAIIDVHISGWGDDIVSYK